MKDTLRQIHHIIKSSGSASGVARTLGVDPSVFRARLVQADLSYEVLRSLPLEAGPATYGDAYDKPLACREIDLNTIPFSDVCDAVFATETAAAASCQLGVRAGALAIHLIKKGIDYDELKACDKSTALARWPDYDLSVTIKADLTRYTFAEIHAVIRETKTPTEAGKRLGGLRENTFRSQLARTGFRYALLKRWDEAEARKNIPHYDASFELNKTFDMSLFSVAFIHEVILETETPTSAAINLGETKKDAFEDLLRGKKLSYNLLKGLSFEEALARFGDNYYHSLNDMPLPSQSISKRPKMKMGASGMALEAHGFLSPDKSSYKSPLGELSLSSPSMSKRVKPNEEESASSAAVTTPTKHGFLSPSMSPYKSPSTPDIARTLDVLEEINFSLFP